MYSGDQPVVVRVDAATPTDALPQLMLLHHTNVADARLELIDLSAALSAEPANLVLTEAGPDAVVSGQSFTTSILIGNDGPGALDGVKVELELDGVVAESWVTPRGSCTIAPAACTLGKLEANERLELGFIGRVGAHATSISVKSLASAAEGCDASSSDNTGALKLDVDPGPGSGSHGQTLVPRGGCGCRAAGGKSDARWLIAALVLLGVRPARRGRRIRGVLFGRQSE